jgi:hypothetical protein
VKSRRRTPHADEILDRISLAYRVEADAMRESPGSYAWMLLHDVRVGVVPYVSSDERDRLRLVTDTDVDDALDRVAEAVDRDRYSDPQYAVSEWIRQCSYDVMVYGCSLFELAYVVNKSSKEPVSFRLLHLSSSHTKRDGYRAVQVVPAGACVFGPGPENERIVSKTFERVIESERTVVIEMPSGSGYKPAKVIRDLQLIGETAHPQFMIPRYGEVNPVPFEFSLFRTTMERAIARLTRDVGWNARWLFQETQTEYHFFDRMLRFEEFKIRLREAIVSGLNSALMRAGRVLKFNAVIRFEGLPTLEDVTVARQHLVAGTKPFEAIVKTFLKLEG